MDRDSLEDLIAMADAKLNAFAVCEIGEDWRLTVSGLDSAICHFIASGRGYLEFGNRRIPIERGSIILVPPHTPKSISGPASVTREVSATESCSGQGNGLLLFKAAEEEAAMVIGCASVSAVEGGSHGLFDRLAEPIVLNIRQGWFPASLDALLHELTQPDIGSRVIAECLMKQALVLLLREHVELGDASPLLAPIRYSGLLRAVSAILKEPGAPHTVQSLADLAGMSHASFQARFVEEHGEPPSAFLESARMHSAARLLHSSDMPVQCLAGAVGYASEPEFSRTFEQTFGIDPTAYRLRRERCATADWVF